MRKTTVYLADEEAEGLRRLAVETQQPQAELVRQAIRNLLVKGSRRQFRSMGIGSSGGAGPRRWSAKELERKVRGRTSPEWR